MEYLNSEMAAPKFIKALWCLLVWTVTVGQSIIHATVTVSSASAPHSWGALLREGSATLPDNEALWETKTLWKTLVRLARTARYFLLNY